MKRSQAGPVRRPGADTGAPQGLELRHLRYFAAVAGAGTFTRAAEQLFIAQPTLSQQIRQLEQLIGAPLLARGRDGVQLTAAGAVLLTAARDVLSRTGHGVSQARQAAGLAGRGCASPCRPACPTPWPSRPPAGCARPPVPPGWPSPGWTPRWTRSSPRSASTAPTPPWAG